MNLDLPPSYRKGKKPAPYRCDTCGDRACRKKWQVVRWMHCGNWKPEVLPLEKLPSETIGSIHDHPRLLEEAQS